MMYELDDPNVPPGCVQMCVDGKAMKYVPVIQESMYTDVNYNENNSGYSISIRFKTKEAQELAYKVLQYMFPGELDNM